MEYFDFEDASHRLPPFDLDDLNSLAPNINEEDATDCFDTVFFDKSHQLPLDPPQAPTVAKLKLINDIEIEVIPQDDDPTLGYPMFRAKQACDLCARMGLDCFLASRGVMITGCTCCISLYKDCSFTTAKLPKGYVNTFQGVPEDSVWNDFSTRQKRALKSFEETRVRKNGARFPRDAVKILKQWLTEHSDHPYPNEREKDELKHLTGLKRSQISNWLANARRRGKVRPPSAPSSPMLGAIDIPRCDKPAGEWENLGPLDRWKRSPPENEPASMTAIARAVTGTPMPGRTSSGSSRPDSKASSRKNSSEDSAFSMFRAPSNSSFETRESSNSEFTFGSSMSNQSKRSNGSAERRRRRRAPMTQRAVAQQTKSRSARIFQCTFCTDTFPAKYDWQRHEKSLHLALERWTCCPDNSPTITVPATGCTHCVFCHQDNPTPEHIESHNFVTCQEKTLQERTFYRKDHLRQHLKLMHGAKFESHMESWKSTTNEIKSACGFCPSKFTSWSQRADHLAAHFRNGADMSTWANGWGFEPYVERLVENAIPPYLIGHERQTMEPYIARFKQPGRACPLKRGSVDSKKSSSSLTFGTSAPDEQTDDELLHGEPDLMTSDSNCWGRLEQELSKYVTTCKLSGNLPSDKELQDTARMIIYEDDDPWNWTCADNQQWLDTFKYQQGIGNITEAMEGKKATLEEVPVLAPYIIKGGNKHNTKIKGHARHSSGFSAQKRMSTGAIQDFKAGRKTSVNRTGSWNIGTTGKKGATASPLPDFDPNMDLDFDAIDFQTLDLGMADMGMDDVTMTTGLDMSGMTATTTGDNMSALTAALTSAGDLGSIYAPATTQGGDFGDVNGAFDANMNLGFDQQALQQQADLQEPFMTEREMRELAGFSASFH